MTSACTIIVPKGGQRIRFTLASNDGRINLVPGITVEMYVKMRPEHGDRHYQTLLLPGEITDAVNGTAVVTLPSWLSARTRRYWYHVDVVGAGGTPRLTASQGQLLVEA